MPIPVRNKDGSLSYKQTADEKLQCEAQQNIKQLNRTVKALAERIEYLENTNRFMEYFLKSKFPEDFPSGV